MKSPVLHTEPGEPSIGRRQILGAASRSILSAGVLGGFPALNLRAQTGFNPGDASEDPQGFWERPRWVWLKRSVTGEQIKVVYWQDGALLAEPYNQLCWFLRDVRFERMLIANDPAIRKALNRGQVSEQHLSAWLMMDPILLDILYAFSAWLSMFGINTPILLTSAFRHLITNLMTEGAARNSWHIQGGAADIVVQGVSPAALARFGLWLSGGGVGIYQSRGFIHLDRGQLRSWRG